MGNTASAAFGIAFSPVPIIAFIMLLFSKRSRLNSLLFVLGWMFAMAAVAAIGFIFFGSSTNNTGGGNQLIFSVVDMVMGLLFLFMAFAKWTGRSENPDEDDLPGWIVKLENMKPFFAFLLGIFLIIVNVKNLPLTINAVARVMQMNSEIFESILTMAAFIAVATSPLIVLLILFEVASGRNRQLVDNCRNWLIRHTSTILVTVFTVLGVYFAAKGLLGFVS